jgi:chromosome segregation ATPase
MNNTTILHRDIEKIALIQVGDDLYSRIQIPSILEKMKDCLDALDQSSSNIDNLLSKGFFGRTWGAISGGTTRTLADAEKALVDSQRFNIGLTVLTSMLAKAIKAQQDEISNQQERIASQQLEIQESQRCINEQHDEIYSLTGVTKEQTHQIVQLLSGDDQLWQTVRRIDQKVGDLGQALTELREGQSGLDVMVREHGSALEALGHSADEFQIRMTQLHDSQQITQSEIADIREILRGNESQVKEILDTAEGHARKIAEHHQAIVGIEGQLKNLSRELAQAMEMKGEIREIQENIVLDRKKCRMTRLLAGTALIVGLLNVALVLLSKIR